MNVQVTLESELGQFFKAVRLKHVPYMSQKTLAENAGVSEQTIQNIEVGRRTPKIIIVLKVAKALGINFELRCPKFSVEETLRKMQ